MFLSLFRILQSTLFSLSISPRFPRVFSAFLLYPSVSSIRMQIHLASASRTSVAELASRRLAITKIATMTTTRKAAMTLPLTRSTSTTAATPRRLLLSPPPRASFLDGLFLQRGDRNKSKASFFQPPSAAPSLVDSLLEAAEGTDAGATDKTSEEQRREIARLAASLRRYRMRSPAQSPLLWGKYRVSYCSNPSAAGGPVLRSGAGRALAKSQVPTQELVEGEGARGSSKIRNRIEFSALGLLPRTAAAQEGPLTVTGPCTYRVVLERATRDFEILYLDERVRVAEFVPSDGRERQLFVFERIPREEEGIGGEEDGFAVEEEEEEEEGEDEDEEFSSSPSSSSSSSSSSSPNSIFGDLGSFFMKPAESLATVVEREERASGSGGGGRSGVRGQKVNATAAKKKKKPPQPKSKQPSPPSVPSFSPPDPAALLEGLVSKVMGEDRDTDSIRSSKGDLAAATAEVKEAARQEREALRIAAPVLRSTAKEREELARAKLAAEEAAARAREAAEEAAERAEQLARAVARAK